MERFVVLLGGSLVPTGRLKAQVAGARTIAADGGMRHADPLGLRPELWVGDFDSTEAALLSHYFDVPRIVLPPEKDATDGELALREAWSRGAGEIVLCGAFGGLRTDHGLLHLAMAMAEVEKGRSLWLTSGVEEAHVILPGEHRFDLPAGSLFSILGYDDLESLSLGGAKWPLHQVRVPFGSSLTLSNEVVGPLSISLGAGRAILLISFNDPGGF